MNNMNNLNKIHSWDEYWGDKKDNTGNHIYDFIAIFYRRYIIKRNLNRFAKKYLRTGSKVLHAGCGSGEVDTDILKKNDITSLDISLSALKLNGAINDNGNSLIQGDIFNIPFLDHSFDCVYNLGVMEHFNEDDIDIILNELKRVTKPGGKIILFWPPEFGLTVLFFKYLYFIYNKVLSRNINLYPDEITRIKSKNHIDNIINRADLEIIEHSFSYRDLFTYYVVVCI